MKSGNLHVCAYIKPSNYGNILKPLVPNYIWKYISGWINYSGTVISLKICENKMDNRVSKSTILNSIIVKEQRVDNSRSINSHLRCTLNSLKITYIIN